MNLEIISNYSKHSDPFQQKEILEYFHSLKNDPNGWRICAEALLNGTITDESAIFFCFQVIEDYVKFRYANDVEENRLLLIHLIFSLFEKEIFETNYLQNKYAHLVNSLFLIDFPQQKWNSFFKDFLDRCKTRMKCELFLRILIQINVDIADRELPRTAKEMQRNTLIKDMMRETCLTDLAQFWFHIINTYHETPPVVCLCLDVIGAYVSWIDINLITNDSIMPVLFMLFSNDQFRCSVADCFNCILRKGMEPFAKTRLVEEFSNFDFIKNTLADIFSDVYSTEFVERFASLINTIGIELIEAQKKQKCKMATQASPNEVQVMSLITDAIESKFNLMCQFLSYKTLSVCIKIHTLVRDYIQWLKSNCKDSDFVTQEKTAILLAIIVERNKALSLVYKPEDEFFIEFRKSSKVLFDNLMLLNSAATLNFICDSVVAPTLAIRPTESMAFSEIEVGLYYFYLIGENMNLVTDQKSVENLVQMLVTSSISMFPHPITQSLYFDLIFRYEKCFNSSLSHLLSQIIVSFLDQRGVRNPNLEIRSKVCKLFNKFIKSYFKTKSNSQEKHQCFIDDILKRIQDFLELDIVFDTAEDLIEQDLGRFVNSTHLNHKENIKYPYPLSCSDQLQIYETVTFLIISSQHDVAQKRELLKRLFTKVWDRFEQQQEESRTMTMFLSQNGFTDSVDKSSLYEKRLITHFHMSHLINLISATSKSFSNVNTVKIIGAQHLYLYSFELFLKPVNANLDPETQHVLQSSIRHFLHRLIVCLDEDEMIPLLPDAIQTLFLSSSEISPKSIQELIPLFSQIFPKYKHSWLFQRDIASFLDRIFSPMISLFFKLIIETNIESDKLSLQKSYYTFLHLLSTHSLMRNFFDSETQLIEKILSSLIEGAVNSPDGQIQRMCFQVMADLVQIYGTDMSQTEKHSRAINSYFMQLIRDRLVLACLIGASNNIDDYQTLQEALTCLRRLAELLGDELRRFLQMEIVPKYFTNNNSSGNIIEDDTYTMLLSSDFKIHKKQIKQIMQKLKR